jgi:hypothetical protein
VFFHVLNESIHNVIMFSEPHNADSALSSGETIKNVCAPVSLS